MSLQYRQFLLTFLIFAFLPITSCKPKTPTSTHTATQALPAHPAPYKVYQGIGDIGEEKGGRVCFVYGKAEHCWNADYGFSEVKAKPIMLPSRSRLILVNALSMGGSDGTIDLALLDEQNQQPVNLLPKSEITSANSGQWDDWEIESVSPLPIIVIANNLWDDDIFISNADSRANAHRYGITVYTYDATSAKYIQRFEYKSNNKYAGDKDVLALEKPIILARLKRAQGN
jgi:hypothetical protein